MASHATVHTELLRYVNPEKAAFFPRFFKTGPGDYGEGDQFLGVTVPHMRLIAKKYKDLDRKNVTALLHSKWHEERAVALFILVLQFAKADEKTQRNIYEFYLSNTKYVNNWDLVDLSCRDIVGRYIYEHQKLLPTLDKLARSKLLWERRIAMVSTYYFLTQGDPVPTLRIAEKLLPDRHDLIQKAVGWMLRELGKRTDRLLLINFIAKYYDRMGRTALRYAVEHFPPETRKEIYRW